MFTNVLLLAGIVAVFAWNWRFAAKMIFVIVVFEGVLRKWLLVGSEQYVYFLKDFVVLVVYLKFFFTAKHEKIKGVLVVNILLFIVILECIVEILNPHLGSGVIGIFGASRYLLYIPLMWVVPSLFRTEKELFNFLRRYLLLLIPVGFLGIAQFFSSPNSIINIYSRSKADADITIATFGEAGRARISGPFPYITGYTIYLTICFCLLTVFLFQKQSTRWRLLCLLEMVLLVANIFMTGSRAPVVTCILFIAVYLFFTNSAMLIKILHRIFWPAVIITLVLAVYFRPVLKSFWERSSATQDTAERFYISLIGPFEAMDRYGILGYGIGSTHQARPLLTERFHLPPGDPIPVLYEDESCRIAIELGLIGFLLWYIFRITIAFVLFRLYYKLKSNFLRQLALCAFFIHISQIGGGLVFNHTFLPYFWFLAGFIFLLPRLDSPENPKTDIR